MQMLRSGADRADAGWIPRWAVAAAIAAVAILPLAATDGIGPREASRPSQRSVGPITLFDGRVVPAMPELLGVREQYELRLRWLERKHAQLLPMMRKHGVGMWIVVNEEFHDDPVTAYIAPTLAYVSRRDVYVFVDGGAEGLRRFSNYWRPTEDYARFFESLPTPRSDRGFQDTATGLRTLLDRYAPKTIALNIDGARGQDSGLTYDSYRFLVEALGPEASDRIVSARDLIEAYFDTRLPEELEYYRALVQATDVLAQTVLSNEVIVPGRTTAADVKWWFEQRVADLGVGAVPWFEIHTAVQRFDPDTGQAIPYVHPAPDDLVYQRGDVIHLDCGFDYLGFASDWQKVAYVLREGEPDVPEGLQVALRNAVTVQEAFLDAPRPGMTGREATIAIMKRLDGIDFLPSLYSHPIGYQGHALGPNLNARNMELGPPGPRDSILRLGAYRSIEFSATTAVPEWQDDTVTIPFEDDAHLTEDGYELFAPAQRRWYLIR